MAQPPPHWRVSFFGTSMSWRESTVRFFLRWRLLSGIELARQDGQTEWIRLHETPLFRDEVPHTGDPAVIAHRRQLRRWLIPGMGLSSWLAFFTVLMIADAPGAEDFYAVVLILGLIPFAMLVAWTARFRESISIGVMGGATEVQAAPAAPAQLPDLDFAAGIDLDALRAELEVIRECQIHTEDPSTATALASEERILREAVSAVEAHRRG